MLRWPRRHGLWMTLAALAALLVLLAVLQYRWIGEFGRAEAERRKNEVDRAANGFAAALEREIGGVLLNLSFAASPQDDPVGALRERLLAQAGGEHGTLVSRVLVVRRGRPRTAEPEMTLEACPADGGACRPVPWTKPLERLRDQFRDAADHLDGGLTLHRERFRDLGDGRTTASASRARAADATADVGPPPEPAFSLRPGEFIEDPLAIVLPLVVPGRSSTPGPGQRFLSLRLAGFAAIELDLDEIRSRLLPQLARNHFGPLAESEFVVTIMRRSDHSVLYCSDASGDRGDARQPEVSLPLLRFRRAWGEPRDDRDIANRRWPDAPPSEVRGSRENAVFGFFGGRWPSRWRRPQQEEPPWLLVVRHREGSLQDAVASMRRRNLAVGLGVLVLLGAAAVLLATGAQRARSLARQQLEFVASVTHELNTPVAGIRSAGQNLAAGIVTDPEQVRRYGRLIDQEGSRLSGLVAQVLDFAGIESGQRAYAKDEVALVPVVEEVLGDLRLMLEGARMTVRQDLPPGLPPVRGDAAALRRAIANVVTNAVKFAASGGRIEIQARPLADGRLLELRIADHGPGIRPEERARVFEPFYRGAAAQRNETPGSGLGLSLVRRIVEAHGGRVRVEGGEHGGAVVVFELPAFEAEAQA